MWHRGRVDDPRCIECVGVGHRHRTQVDRSFLDSFLVYFLACLATERPRDARTHLKARPGGVYEHVCGLLCNIPLNHLEVHVSVIDRPNNETTGPQYQKIELPKQQAFANGGLSALSV
jgi:hypothetical protein